MLILALGLLPSAARANIRSENSINLNYGAHINLYGPQLSLAVETAISSQIEWIAIDLSWKKLQGNPDDLIDDFILDQFMKAANDNDLKVMLSITDAPDWAIRDYGPDFEATAILVKTLVGKYPAIQAVELFPGANTVAGWGTTPNPAGYMAVLVTSEAELKAMERLIPIVVGGFMPALFEGDIQETIYLDTLYQLQGAPLLSQVSIRYPEVDQDISLNPIEHSNISFRRYEALRNIMRKYGHLEGKIWVTEFSWPKDQLTTTGQQSGWLMAAYNQMRSQLYIEISFFKQLNPENDAPNWDSTNATIVSTDGKIHPGIQVIQHLVSQTNDRNSGISIVTRLLSPRFFK